LLRFIIKSYSFRRILPLTAMFIVFFFAFSKTFDHLWYSSTTIPIINLNDLYSPPIEYDNLTRVNLKKINPGQIGIEGNKSFRIKDHKPNFDFYDTINIFYPDTTFDHINKIFLEFEESLQTDSIYFVTAKSENPGIYYNQIFYSSVIVNKINRFSDPEDNFRINRENLVSGTTLIDNDSLISLVFSYFNENMNTLGLAECGTNSRIFYEVCQNFKVPCRIVSLQGGDSEEYGYNEYIGYPLHVVCEIYSSKTRKWYIVDPTYGIRFRDPGDLQFLNAVEICNRFTFGKVSDIKQDSTLLTRRSLVGKDYFKYYENIIFSKSSWKNPLLIKAGGVFYSKFIYFHQVYSNNSPFIRNGIYYIGLKTFIYFFLLLLYINLIMLLFIRRLFLIKKPEQTLKT
jgi:hypothetical protein